MAVDAQLEIPQSSQILVVGGGPAGSYAATVLAREGFTVTLIESSKFPRYHIGESLLPSVREFLRFVDAEEKMKSHGFTVKPGGAVKVNAYKREGYTDFVSLDPNNGSWNVIRSEFDSLLLRHAASSGVTVIEETKIIDILFEDDHRKRPTGALWKSKNGAEGKIRFQYLVDASGRQGIMSTKYLRNRHINTSLKNLAFWGYWTGTGRYSPGTIRENAIWIENLDDGTGWAWFIPLHNGTTSIGIVIDKTQSEQKKRARPGAAPGLQEHYLCELRRAPGVLKLIGEGKLREDQVNGTVKSATDFSYSASEYAGDHFRIVGDAAAFIDPFFSSGVHLAMTGALSAALTIAASIRGAVTEDIAASWHTKKFGESYTRFLMVVLGFYKQMRNMELPVLADVDEDNFDRAFNLIRPVIQGDADVGKKLTEDELQKTMEFCKHINAPTDPEMYQAVAARIDPALLSSGGSVLSESDIAALIPPEDQEARIVLAEVNARKPIHTMYAPLKFFEDEHHIGFRAVVQQGRLGLCQAA